MSIHSSPPLDPLLFDAVAEGDHLAEITITPAGVVHFTGRVHDSGALGVSYHVTLFNL